MGLSVNTNIAAMNAYRNLSTTNNAMSKSLERLSSGFRINRAADDAAGLAISEGLRSQIGGLTQAVRNTQDGTSVVQTAEGALSESTSILQRMRDLSVQASNSGSLNTTATASIQKEIGQLKQELDRIANTTTFNGTKLLDGSFNGAFQVGANAGQTITVTIGHRQGHGLDRPRRRRRRRHRRRPANAAARRRRQRRRRRPRPAVAAIDHRRTAADFTSAHRGAADLDQAQRHHHASAARPSTCRSVDYSRPVTANAPATSPQLQRPLRRSAARAWPPVPRPFTATVDRCLKLHRSGGPGRRGADDPTLRRAGHPDASPPASGASAAITAIDAAITQVSSARADLGAKQNRFEHTINNLNTTIENTTASESRIRDTDMASEMTNFTRTQVLTQAGTAMLAQANQSTQSILKLLG